MSTESADVGEMYLNPKKVSNNELIKFETQFHSVWVSFITGLDLHGFTIESIGDDAGIALKLFISNNFEDEIHPIWPVFDGEKYEYFGQESQSLRTLSGDEVQKITDALLY